MFETFPFKEGTKQLIITGDCAWPKGKLVVQPNSRTKAIGLIITVPVLATAATAALTQVQRDAVLKAFTFTFTAMVSAGTAKCAAIQNETLFDCRLDARRALEMDMQNYIDANVGLARPFGTGAQNVQFVVYIPVSWVEPINESPQIFGLGYEQMLDSEAQLKANSDPFRLASANLSVSGNITVKAFPVWEKTSAPHVGVPLVMRTLTNAGNQFLGTQDDGLYLSAEDVLYGTAATDLQTIKVTRGLLASYPTLGLVEADEALPATIEGAYERAPNTGALEASNSSYRTPVSLLIDQPLKNVQTGQLGLTQIIGVRDWRVRVVFFPRWTAQQVSDIVASMAATLADGGQLIAVSNAVTQKVDCGEQHLPFCGFTWYSSEDPRFYAHSGLRCVKGQAPVVHIPDTELRRYARLCFDALQPGKSYATGDVGKVKLLHQEALRGVPGVVDQQAGYRSETWVFSDGRKQIKDATAELTGAYAAQAAALKAKGVAVPG